MRENLFVILGLGGHALLLAVFLFLQWIRKHRDAFEVINWMVLSMGLFYFLRPLYVLIQGLTIVAYPAFSYAIGVGCVGTASMLLGYYWKQMRQGRSPGQGVAESGDRRKDRPLLVRMNRKRLLVVYIGALMVVYVVISKDYLVALSQGIPLLEVGLARGQISGTQASFLHSYYWVMFYYLAFVAFFCLYADLLRNGGSRGWWVTFALLTPLHLGSYVVGTRWGLITQLIAFVALPLYIRKGRVPWQIMIVAAIPLLLIFQGYNIFRGTGSIDLALRATSMRDALLGHLFSFDNGVILLQALRDGTLDFLWGYNYLLLPIHIVPRAFWSDKPVLSPTTLFTEAFYGTPGSYVDGHLVSAQTITAPMEFYWQGGMAGVILGMWLWGVIARAVFDYMRREIKHGNVFSYVFYLWFSMQTFNSMRDSLFSLIPFMLLFWVGWRFVAVTCSKRVFLRTNTPREEAIASFQGWQTSCGDIN